MDKNIIEILELILENIKKDKDISQDDILKMFNESSKDSFLDKIEDDTEELEEIKTEDKNSFRYLLETEKMFFTKEAQGEIIQLQTLGLISSREVEELIETAIFRDFRLIDKEALSTILPQIIAQSHNVGENSKTFLGNHNTIN